MPLPRFAVSFADSSRPPAFTPMRLAAWLAVVLVLSKSLSLNRTHDYWWLIDLPMASFGDVLFALGVGMVGNVAVRAAATRPAIQNGLRHAFVALCVICAFYS